VFATVKTRSKPSVVLEIHAFERLWGSSEGALGTRVKTQLTSVRFPETSFRVTQRKFAAVVACRNLGDAILTVALTSVVWRHHISNLRIRKSLPNVWCFSCEGQHRR